MAALPAIRQILIFPYNLFPRTIESYPIGSRSPAQVTSFSKLSFQAIMREGDRDTTFDPYVRRAERQWTKHYKKSALRLQFHAARQIPSENWTEFQCYHLQGHEELEVERDRMKMEVGDDREGAKKAAADISGLDDGLRYFEQKLQGHDLFLRWIERKRVEMMGINSLRRTARTTGSRN